VFESDTVNVEYVQQLMAMYKSNPVDWKRYAKFDRCR
jgi:cysteine dioxygenase